MYLLRVGRRLRPYFTCHQLPQRAVTRQYKTEAVTFGYTPKESRFTDVDSNARTGSECVTKDTLSIQALVNAFRQRGHIGAKVNPLHASKHSESESSAVLANYALHESDSITDALASDSPLLAGGVGTAGALLNRLDSIYCQDMTVEVAHMLDQSEQEWFCSEYERINQLSLDTECRKEAAILMKRSQVFENFVASRFTTIKRYGGDGCQALMALFHQLFRESATSGVEQIVIGMPHRARLNLQTTLLKFPPVEMFQKMKGMREWPDEVTGSGDILSHLSNGVTLDYKEGSLYTTMIPNPSHLEAASPVAVGKTRAKQRWSNDGDYCNDSDRNITHKTLCVQLHGDASFAGQGVIQETFALSGVPHYSIGGSLHVIVNNQLGFTTEAERGRTSAYSSCVSKMNSVPIIRVNGENPDAVMKAVMAALSYRNAWHKDVIIDMICYRKYGHNELDNPSFTQPIMYKVIDSLQPLPDRYTTQLVEEGICTDEEVKAAELKWTEYLNGEYNSIDTHQPKANHLEKQWAGMVQARDESSCWDTGVSTDLLRYIAVKSVSTPEDFVVHPTLIKSHVQRRIERTEQNMPVDWATAETLAFGSVLCQGYDVRISGQDVGRGTFSHRHVMLVDQETDTMYVPLNNLREQQTNYLEVCNSILSEEAVLGFEYGFSIESPKCLTVWEAQFGDFFNGAQIIIDTYVSSGEAKWLKQSGLVMLLPTGMDGAGPDHSSCRLERFLQLTDSKECSADGDSVNMSITYPTTPAQYFHLLRRQVVRNFRKPLIMAAPKVLLRHPAAVSTLSDMSPGTTFEPVLDDRQVNKSAVTKVIFCCGQHYYNLVAERERRNLVDTAIIRIEELCPFPTAALQRVASSYPSAKSFTWAQEEHRNYGCWTFVRPRFENMVGLKLRYAGRDELSNTATGVGKVHKAECTHIMDSAFSS